MQRALTAVHGKHRVLRHPADDVGGAREFSSSLPGWKITLAKGLSFPGATAADYRDRWAG